MKHPSSKALVFLAVLLSWSCNRSPEQKVAKLLASAKESSAKQENEVWHVHSRKPHGDQARHHG